MITWKDVHPLAICKVCGKEYRRRRRRSKGLLRNPYVRPSNSVTCSIKCSKINARKSSYVKVSNRYNFTLNYEDQYKIIFRRSFVYTTA